MEEQRARSQSVGGAPAPQGADPISARVRKETQDALQKVSNVSAAIKLWNEWLTPREKEHLGGDLMKALNAHGGTVGLFMKVRQLDQVEAILTVAHLVGFLRDLDRDRLRREWGLPAQKSPNDQRPTWNPETGKLYWGRQLIRTIRLIRPPSNLQILIEAFEAENWPEVIDSPFQYADKLYDAVRGLKTGLKRIAFSAVAGAARCRWDVMPPQRRTP